MELAIYQACLNMNMGRILAIDYGTKRIGMAVTDQAQIISTALDTVPAADIFSYLKKYMATEPVESFVVGDPRNLDNTPAEVSGKVRTFIDQLKKQFKDIPVHMVDERFTSKIAAQSMVLSGMKKKDRRKKENLDKISATLILQTFLESKRV